MTTLFPQRAFGKPDVAARPSTRDNRQETSIVPLAGSSPAVSVFGNRSPLAPLGANASSFGIRQRRQQKESTVSLDASGNGFPRASSQKMMGPPRASLTLSMGSDTSAPSVTGTGNDVSI